MKTPKDDSVAQAYYVFNCGCGFRCNWEAGAEKHVKETGHEMHVSGKVTLEPLPR